MIMSCPLSGSPISAGDGIGGASRSIGRRVPACTFDVSIRSNAQAITRRLIVMRARMELPLRCGRCARDHPARLDVGADANEKCLLRLRGPRGGQALDLQVRDGGD